MKAPTQRRGKEETVRLGEELYESTIKPQLSPNDHGKLLAIDVGTGEYELGNDEFEAVDKLRARILNAEPFLMRVGSKYLCRFGGWSQRESP